jgi:hypothetical protein
MRLIIALGLVMGSYAFTVLRGHVAPPHPTRISQPGSCCPNVFLELFVPMNVRVRSILLRRLSSKRVVWMRQGTFKLISSQNKLL